MAKIKRGEGLQDLRGSVGQHVYSDWRGRGYLRSKSISGSNPGSSRQADTRSTMASISRAWKSTLTDNERALWNEYAKTQVRRKPDPKRHALIIPAYRVTMSGFNTFVSINRLLFEVGLIVPPAVLSVPPDSSDITPSSPLDLAAAWNYGFDTYLAEDFEDEALNSIPNQWTPLWLYNAPATSYIKVVNAPVHAGIRAAEISTLLGLVTAFHQVPQLSTDNVELHLYARAAQNNLVAPIIYTTLAAAHINFGVMLAFWLDGTLRYSDFAVWTIAQPYVAGTWYHIKAVIHNAARKWDLFIDDMVTPVVTGINYRSNNSCTFLELNNVTGTIHVDDLLVRLPVTLGLSLTWTDPSNAPVGSIIRTWTQSHNVGVHKQQVDVSALGTESSILTQARIAQGKTVSLTNLPGIYKLQLDCISPAGKQSAPSNLVEVNVP